MSSSSYGSPERNASAITLPKTPGSDANSIYTLKVNNYYIEGMKTAFPYSKAYDDDRTNVQFKLYEKLADNNITGKITGKEFKELLLDVMMEEYGENQGL